MRATFTTVATIAIVATLPALATPDVEWPPSQYVTTIYKGLVGRQLDETLGPFYIPDGQCSGVLDSMLICESGRAPAGVGVRVEDTARFPLIALHDTLQTASVLRAPPCRGESTVSVQLVCDNLLLADNPAQYSNYRTDSRTEPSV